MLAEKSQERNHVKEEEQGATRKGLTAATMENKGRKIMLATYRYNNSEAIETVYTYDEWFKEYKRREAKRRIRQRTEHFHCMKQRVCGVIMAAVGIISPLLLNGEAGFSLFALPLGIFLLLTKEKVVTF